MMELIAGFGSVAATGAMFFGAWQVRLMWSIDRRLVRVETKLGLTSEGAL